MRKVLVVEDNLDLQFLMVRRLRLMGFDVSSADDGIEGVQKAFEEKPDLILMDIMMPGRDGREATQMIRSNPETRKTPILAVTVLKKKLDLESCIEAGCNDYLVKPVTQEQLQDKIQKLIPIWNPAVLHESI